MSAHYKISGYLFVIEGCYRYTSVWVQSASLHFMGYWKAIGNMDFHVAMFYKSLVGRVRQVYNPDVVKGSILQSIPNL